MKLAQLERRHPDYDGETLRRYRLLFEGGAAWHRAAKEFLPRHDVEPHDVYKRRLKSAKYLNYAAPLVGSFVSWLFTGTLGVRVRDASGDELPEWSSSLKEDSNGRTDLDAMLGRAMTEALVTRRAFLHVESAEPPPGLTLAEWQRQGFDRAQVELIPTERVTHWHADDEGRFHWLVEREECIELESFDGAEKRVIEWTLWSATQPPRRWRLELDPSKAIDPNTDVPEVTTQERAELPARPGVPFVCLELPQELWLLNLAADPIVGINEKRNALSWAIDRVCYAMPVLYSQSRKPVGAMGAGYFLQLGANDRLEYPAPPSTPFDVIENHIRSLKDELYRVTQQMAAGVENNAAAIGRSGESKSADAEATMIVLRKLGALVRDALERVYDLAADLLGQPERFAAYGLDSFRLESVGSVVEVISGVELAAVQSPTLRAELHKQLASRALPHVPTDVLAKINAEIDGPQLDETTPSADALAANDTGAAAASGDAGKVADLAFNGAQIASLVDVVKSAALGEIPRDSAKAIIVLSFPTIDDAEAERVLGSIGKGFDPAQPEPSGKPEALTAPTQGAARQPPSTTGEG